MVFRYSYLLMLLSSMTQASTLYRPFYVRVLLDAKKMCAHSPTNEKKDKTNFYHKVSSDANHKNQLHGKNKPAEQNWWWEIQGNEPLLVTDLLTHEKMLARAVRIYPDQHRVCLIDTKRRQMMTGAIRVQSQGPLKVGNSSYRGSLYAVAENDQILLINNLDIEDYIFGVLRSEGFPGWPVAFYQVLAIASRSYVITKIIEAERNNRLFHVKNSNSHQTYYGHHEDEDIAQAVRTTRDLFLTHHDKPVMAMYDICCGGVIPSQISGLNFAATPYLARPYPCTHCKTSKAYRWEVTYTMDHFERIIRNELSNVKKVSDIKVASKDRAGLVQKVLVKAHSGNHYLPAKRLPSLTRTVKSRCFTIHRTTSTIRLAGRGFGHQIGLCQWGARTLVTKGWDYEKILKFYYPGTHIAQLDRNNESVKLAMRDMPSRYVSNG